MPLFRSSIWMITIGWVLALARFAIAYLFAATIIGLPRWREGPAMPR